MEVNSPAALPFHRMLGGSQGRSKRMWKISPLAGFDPQTVEPLYRLRYPDPRLVPIPAATTHKALSGEHVCLEIHEALPSRRCKRVCKSQQAWTLSGLEQCQSLPNEDRPCWGSSSLHSGVQCSSATSPSSTTFARSASTNLLPLPNEYWRHA
jgi:hypothetical protein